MRSTCVLSFAALGAMFATGAVLSGERRSLVGAATVPILMYHHVNELRGDPDKVTLRYTVPPGEFEKQIDWLKQQGYETVTPKQVCENLEDGVPLPAKPVVLTFDDGWSCGYATVFPLLRSRGMVGSFYVYPSGIGSPGYMTWDQLKEMESAGMDVEAHSMTHPRLVDLKDDAAVREIRESKRLLEEKLGTEVDVFAYPFGLFDGRIERLVSEAGYECALSTDVGVQQRESERFRLRRVLVTYTDSLDVFAKTVAPAAAPAPATVGGRGKPG